MDSAAMGPNQQGQAKVQEASKTVPIATKMKVPGDLLPGLPEGQVTRSPIWPISLSVGLRMQRFPSVLLRSR